MSDNKPIVIENGVLKESNTSGTTTVDITSSDPSLTVSNPSSNTFVIGFDSELSKIPAMKKSFIAGESISALKLVYAKIDGRVYVGDNEDTFDKALIIGVALNAAPLGSSVEVLLFGILEDSSWNWTVNELLFLNTNGSITSIAPVIGYHTTVAKALSSTSILVNINEPIEL